MNASVDANASSSRETEALAAEGARSAEQGGKAVSEAVDAMRAIAERISIVEEIAYQTKPRAPATTARGSPSSPLVCAGAYEK